jgi:hypothetical protein
LHLRPLIHTWSCGSHPESRTPSQTINRLIRSGLVHHSPLLERYADPARDSHVQIHSPWTDALTRYAALRSGSFAGEGHPPLGMANRIRLEKYKQNARLNRKTA